MTNDNYGSDEVVEEAAVEAVAVAALEGRGRVRVLVQAPVQDLVRVLDPVRARVQARAPDLVPAAVDQAAAPAAIAAPLLPTAVDLPSKVAARHQGMAAAATTVAVPDSHIGLAVSLRPVSHHSLSVLALACYSGPASGSMAPTCTRTITRTPSTTTAAGGTRQSLSSAPATPRWSADATTTTAPRL